MIELIAAVYFGFALPVIEVPPDHHPSDVPVAAASTEPVQRTYSAADAIADCESGHRLADGTAIPGSFRLTVHNPTSSASGKYQFVDRTWQWVTGLQPPASAHPEHVQDAAFQRLWDEGRGARHWEPSRSCWERMLGRR